MGLLISSRNKVACTEGALIYLKRESLLKSGSTRTFYVHTPIGIAGLTRDLGSQLAGEHA